jgi:hypothetical protein
MLRAIQVAALDSMRDPPVSLESRSAVSERLRSLDLS